MTFEQYCSLIETTTARVHGYQMFLPSLYVPGGRPTLQVYDCLPAPGSDEAVAINWASPYMTEGQTLYMAYRGDRGIINVCEYIDGQLVRSRRVNVDRFSYGACG